MKSYYKIFLLLALFFGILFGCEDEPLPEIEPDEPEPKEAPELTQKINSFIEFVMEDVYLWNEEMPDIDIRYEFDSKDYFDKLLYEEDKWSFVTEDMDEWVNSLQGIEKSYGWSLAFGRFQNTNTIFALVEYVNPNTPAAEANFQRGDIIVQLAGADITDDNYRDLLNSESITVTSGVLGADGVSLGSEVSMTARELNIDPVLTREIIEYEGHKIGYICYTQFSDNHFESLNNSLQYFSENAISDLVVDLRYNPGGYGFVAQHFCSSVAPLNIVNEEEILITNHYNQSYTAYFEKNDPGYLQTTFLNDVPVKLGLDKIHILTGRGSASASELFIVGLEPYMDLTTVGESTYGKYTGSWTIRPEHVIGNSSDYEDFEKWGVQPIVMRYANSLGVTDFKDGILPDIEVYDELFEAVPLGQKEEPLLKAAIEDITGTPIIAMKSAKRIDIPYTIFDRGFSKFDQIKREMVIQNINPEILK